MTSPPNPAAHLLLKRELNAHIERCEATKRRIHISKTLIELARALRTAPAAVALIRWSPEVKRASHSVTIAGEEKARQLIREKVSQCDEAIESGDTQLYKKHRLELLEHGRHLRGYAPIGAREVEVEAAKLEKRAGERSSATALPAATASDGAAELKTGPSLTEAPRPGPRKPGP